MVRLALRIVSPHTLLSAQARCVRALLAAVAAWRARARQRRHLARLDDAQLKDIGVTRSEAENEAAKPFWKE